MKIYFIGIGGIGTSALAQYYLSKGHEVSGSDLVSSEVTDFLRKKGAKLFLGKHLVRNLPKDADMVIYSPAIQKNNPELKQARRFQVLGYKLQILSYPQVLGELTKKYFTIAVSGTHGKSTTTVILSLILEKAGLDPTVIVGTRLKEFGGSNFRAGESRYLVIEADEWQASFLNYYPQIIVLTNIEAEHLDYYKNLNRILKTYREYIRHLPKNGTLIVNRDDKNIIKVIKQKFVNTTFSTAVENVVYYSLKEKEKEEIKKLRKILKIPGEHNIYNALAALSVARALKIPDKVSFKAISEYRGSWRRFEIKKGKIDDKSFTLIDDYAHHPTEIKATLKAAKEKFPHGEIWSIFQPHQYQRTYYLFDDFVKEFSKAPVSRIIITDIYDVAGREKSKIKKRVSSKKLVEKIKKESVIYLAKDKIEDYLKDNLKGGEIVVIMGAGNIYELAKKFSTLRV